MVQLPGLACDPVNCRQVQEHLESLSRTHAVLSRCNRSLARATSERTLLEAFCTNLVEMGGFGFAWVGYAEHQNGRVRAAAYAGKTDARFVTEVFAAANSGRHRSASRVACEDGEPVMVRDLAVRSELAPWAGAALKRGLRSMIALPLSADGTPFGNFSIFASTPDAFGAPQFSLLVELAADLSFGVQALRARAVQAQEERRLRSEVERDARARLAASLHDGVGQTLQALNLGLKLAREMAERQCFVPVALLDRLVGEAGDALREVRTVGCELHPPFLDRLSLFDAVRLHCSEIAQRAGRPIHVNVDDCHVSVEPRVKEQCFLAFREALSNALRHAQASRILVALRVRPHDRLTLMVIDDGIGFDTLQTRERPAGLGLRMIHERAADVLGAARIRSARGRGTQVRISVPLPGGSDPCA